MANKDKLIAAAQKFLAKGQVAKAVGEYRKLLEAFPRDIRNRQKLAELLSRDKRSHEALAEYEFVAKHYTDTGFYLKAIAVYKQMQKLDPSRVDIYHRLAELNEKQGLIGNALSEYRNLVAFYEQNHLVDEAVGVLLKMAELDRGNLNVRSKVIDTYKNAQRGHEAAKMFQDMVIQLLDAREYDKVVKLFDRFLDICPEETPARLPLASALLACGQSERAVSLLKELLKLAPQDRDVLEALAEGYLAMNDFGKARLILRQLAETTPGDLDLCGKLIGVCFDTDARDLAKEVLAEAQEACLSAGRGADFRSFCDALQTKHPHEPLIKDTLRELEQAEADPSVLQKHVPDDAPQEPGTMPNGPEIQPGNARHPSVGFDVELELDLDGPANVPERQDVSDQESVEIEIEMNLDGLGALELEIDTEEEPSEEVSHARAEAEAGMVVKDDGGAPPVEETLSGFDLSRFDEMGSEESLEEIEPVEEPDGLAGVRDHENDEEIVELEDIEEFGSLDVARPHPSAPQDQEMQDDLTLKGKPTGTRAQPHREAQVEKPADFGDLMSGLDDEELLSATDFLGQGAAQDDSEGLGQKLASELDTEDTESHFNLGIAYKEMGLYRDAIEEFEKASINPSRTIDCLTFKGQCFIEMGRNSEAESVFQEGLALDHLQDEARMTLHYELGVLYQVSGRLFEALENFHLVADQDLFFRDVGDKIKSLRKKLGLDEEDGGSSGPQGNRDRVSYV